MVGKKQELPAVPQTVPKEVPHSTIFVAQFGRK
jgi:hypothetical protein